MSSSERSGEFYGVWPVLDGKQLNLQWGEIRRNTAETKAVVRGSFQDIEDGADSLNALRALIGLAFGEQGFDNKYRLAYNKTTSEFCAQKNDGTEAVPVWQDVWCIRFSDGQFQVTSEGGIQSSAGFYGPLPHDLLAIGEILTSGALGGTQFVNPNELYFNTNTGFYLTSVTSGPRAGKPIVNFAFPFGKSKTFPKSGKVWQVAHNFNTTPVLVQAMNDGDVVVIPDKIDVSDPNNTWFYFNEVTSGKALIATGGTGAVELVPALAITDGTNDYTNVEDLNFSEVNFYLTSDLAGSPVVNMDDHFPHDLSLVPGGVDEARFLTIDSGVSSPSFSQIKLQDRGTTKWTIRKDAGNDLEFANDNGNVIHIESDAQPSIAVFSTGSVGIGQFGASSQRGLLHVSGSIYAEDDVQAEAFYLTVGGDWNKDNLHVIGGGIFAEQLTAAAFYTTGAKAGEVSPLTVTDGTNPFTDVETAHFNNANFYITEKDGQPVINTIEGGSISHSVLQGLSNDDHTQYARTDGTRDITGHQRFDDSINVENAVVAEAFYLHPGSGGSIFKDGDDLGIQAAAVDSQVVLKSKVLLQPDDASIIGKVSPNGVALNFAPNFSTTSAAGILSTLQIIPTINVEDSTYRYRGITSAGVLTAKVDAGSTARTYGYRTRLDLRADLGFIAGNYVGLADETEFKHTLSSDNTAKPMAALISVLASPTIEASAVGAKLRTDSFTAVKFQPLLDTGVVSVVDLGAVRGLWCANPAVSAGGGLAGTEQADSYTGVDVESPAALTISGNTIALNSAIPAGATNYLIKNPGGAQADFGGGNIVDVNDFVSTGKVVGEAFYVASGGQWDDLGLDVDGTFDATTGTFSGRVGIGTASPTATFEVVGHGRFSEQLEAGAFYLQSGSGGGLWKESNNVVLGSKDGHVVLKVNGNSSAVKIDPVNPGTSQSYLFAAPNFSTATSGVVTEIFIRHNPVVSVLSVSYIPSGVKLDGIYTQGAVPNVTFGDSVGYQNNQIWKTEGTFGLHRTTGFLASQTLRNDAGGTPTETTRTDGFVFRPQLSVTTASDRMAVTEMVAVTLDVRWNTVAAATIDFGTVYGLKGKTPTVQLFGTSAGTEQMEGYILVHLEDITSPASIGATGVTCVKSDLSAGATNWFLDNPGGAQSDLGGGDLFNIGDVGFFGAAAQSKPTVTGSRTDGTALADLLTELATLGLITDSSSA